ncbi:hypothetical protein M0R45_023497 [Rubus argutus]|uniref:Uncharacterized protein n=1 Tax=Rubus argutus TaxID=59490 RepID=A0AAW1WQI5_RUBAR
MKVKEMLQGDNVVEFQEPEKEDESKSNVAEAEDGIDDSRKLLAQNLQEKVGEGVKLDVTEPQLRDSKQDEDCEANVAYSTKDSEEKVTANDVVDDGKVQENDAVDVVVVETQSPETQTQTLVEPKFSEPEQDESNLGHSAKEADGSSKGLVQNLEAKVGVDTVDDGKVQENNAVDVVVVETQSPETQTQTLVEPKFGEPEQDESNLGHSAIEADGSSKSLVQNLEAKVGVDTVDHAKIPENDVVDFVVVETQFPETQTQTLVEPKIGEPEQDERNLGHLAKETDENSKEVVQNLEENVAKISEDDELIDQFAQEQNGNAALKDDAMAQHELKDDAMAQHELNKKAMAAAEASSSVSNKEQPKEFFLVLTDSGRAVLGFKGENGKFLVSKKHCEVLKQGRQGNTEGRQFEGTTRIFLRPKIPPDSDKNEREEESEDEKKKKASLLQWLKIHKDSEDETTQFLTALKTRASQIGVELSSEFINCFLILSAWEPVAKTLKQYKNQTPPSLVTSSLLICFNMAADHFKLSRKEGGKGIEHLFSEVQDVLQLFQQALNCLEDALCGSHILETEEDLSSVKVKGLVDTAGKTLELLKYIARSKMSMFNGILDEQLKENIGEVWNNLEKENGGSSVMAYILKGAKYVRDKQVDFEQSHPQATRYGKYFVKTAVGFPGSLILDYPKAYGIVDGLTKFIKAPRIEKKKRALETAVDTMAWTGLCYVGKKLKGQAPSGIDLLQVIWEQVPSTVSSTQPPVKQEQENFSGYWVASVDEDDDTVIIDLFEEEVNHGGVKIEDLEDWVHLE